MHLELVRQSLYVFLLVVRGWLSDMSCSVENQGQLHHMMTGKVL